MTWQVGSAVVLSVALALGFGWYERSRPPARVLALVAALAALAAIGRLAFAAFPNVKPTSDIVLFSGFALGGPAGFAVGAVAAIVSNVFLGQGPWTPWQMAAWGVVGLLGALLGRVMRGREPNRIFLAGVCGVAGFVFGGLMDMYQWTLAAQHTLASYLAISGTSFTFNVAHAVGNVAFALVMGPAFLRALSRYRRRFAVRWLAAAPVGAVVLVAISVGLASPRPAAAATPKDVARAIEHAAHYLRQSQNADGGFGAARGQSSSAAYSAWVALGLAAAGQNPRDVASQGHSIVDYLVSRPEEATDIGAVERTMLVLRASGLPPRLGSRNLLAELDRKQQSNGSFGTINHTAFGILALRAAGRTTRSRDVRRALRSLARAANRDGGFGFVARAASDVDDTGAVVQALVAGGGGRTAAVSRAVAYLRKAQRPDGGFGQMAGGDSNAQSTSFAIQGLVAAGQDPRKLRRTRTPLEYLKTLQAPDGFVRYSRTSAQTPVWVTAQALDALATKPFPLRPTPRARAAQVHFRPVAQTTATTATTAGPRPSGKRSYWGYIFAVIAGVVVLALMRLGWRRG